MIVTTTSCVVDGDLGDADMFYSMSRYEVTPPDPVRDLLVPRFGTVWERYTHEPAAIAR